MSLKDQGLIPIKFYIMKKRILNFGKALNKAEQKQINGGGRGGNLGDCLIPGPGPLSEPILVGHVPCDGVSLCPGQPNFLGGAPYPPMCFAF